MTGYYTRLMQRLCVIYRNDEVLARRSKPEEPENENEPNR